MPKCIHQKPKNNLNPMHIKYKTKKEDKGKIKNY